MFCEPLSAVLRWGLFQDDVSLLGSLSNRPVSDTETLKDACELSSEGVLIGTFPNRVIFEV